MSTPQKPHWTQPSHPDIQKVVYATSESGFGTKSYSTVNVAPHGVYTTLDFPPLKLLSAGEVSYATVQVGKNEHVDLGCDFLYIEHSCDPSLIFDTTQALSSTNGNITLRAGPRGLKPGDELTFFYPSTEWDMAQPFECHCGAGNCLGSIRGAKHLSLEELKGTGKGEERWVSEHVLKMVKAREGR